MSDKCNAPVGVFDSGVGGLTVAREIMRNLPEENICLLYTSDAADEEDSVDLGGPPNDDKKGE